MASEKRWLEHLANVASEEDALDEAGLELLMTHHQIPPGPLVQRYRALAVAMARISVPGFQRGKPRPGRPAVAWKQRFLIITLVHGLKAEHGSLTAAAAWLDQKPLSSIWPPVAKAGFYEAYREAWKSKEVKLLRAQLGDEGAVQQIVARTTAALESK